MLNYFKYRKLAYFDILCGCYNRNFIETKLKKKFDKKQCLVSIIDIDNFKSINDMYGHLTGDQSLRQFVDVLKTDPDIKYICRFGGDEFIIIHDEPIHFKFYQDEFESLTKFTFSFGTVNKSAYTSFEEALKEADKKLYINKRNRKQKQK